ncbi:hypothetical protein BKA62DRAFT_834554 [Auriculariales sp. MPI-PUGE-AT-0066]|nr:hypothetical protein BKA62DRAFT_834554 [Auriculariales sp. MPI-PUGE-AT-0066]
MVNMTDGLPWPLKAVPQTFLQIVQHLEKGQAVAAGVTQLLTEVQAHWDLVAQFHVPDGRDDRLQAQVEIFFQVLFGVFIRLRVLQVTHPVASRIAVDSYNTALGEESQRVASAARTLESARDWKVANDVARVTEKLLVADTESTANFAIDLDVCSVPPPKPNVFHGRDDTVKSLVEKAIEHSTRQASANLGILGNGGLGKISLVQVVMWDRPIVEHFGPRRFFLSRTLLVLDNLETVWLVPDDRARSQLELLLRRLAAISTLTLIITSRGVVLPRGIRWENVASATLEPFSAEAALQTFDDIAETSKSDDETERAAVMELMKDVDYMPLAVTLLAQLAQCGEKPSRPGDNVAASIAVSIQLLTAGPNSEEPLQLLSICAHLPAGLRTSVFDQLMPLFKDLDSSRRSLKALALISVGPQGELKMLSPIRHFVLSAHPMTADHNAAMRQIHFSIAASAPTKLSEEFTTKSTAVAAEYENLNVFLLHLIDTEEPSQSLVHAVRAVSEYAYLTSPSLTLLLALWSRLDALWSRLDGHARWLAECCTHIGRIYLLLCDYSSAIDALLKASAIFDRIGFRQAAAYCALLLGDCRRNQGFNEVAVQQYTAARDTFLELQDHFNASMCLMRLGGIVAAQGKYEDAKQYLTSARSAFTGESKHRVYAADCTSSLGRIYTREGNLAMAETELQIAQSEYQVLGNQWGIRKCMRLLGDLRRRQRDFSSAEELLVSAREQSTRTGMPLEQAGCINAIGLLRRDQGRTHEALEAFRAAAQIYERMGAAVWLTNCRLAIEGLENVPI